ncbi:MAG: TetR family transcriptional regulator [Stagnimonas sp.]|nr:TetR family transcriptional regulator [Stagnimonas sp.]
MPVAKAKPAPKPAAPLELGGRRRLIEAALRLAAEKRGLQGIGLRELGREAGLNPNTFYRHFRDLDALYAAVVEEFGAEIGPALRNIRLNAPIEQVPALTTELVFDIAKQNPEAFIVGVRELHGALDSAREALRRRLTTLAQEMADDVLVRSPVPGLDEGLLRELARSIVEHVFLRTLDYLENPRQRAALVRRTALFIDSLLYGSVVVAARERAARRPIQQG